MHRLTIASSFQMPENTLVRSVPCPECGDQMLWTQNAWRAGDTSSAAYQCHNGHVVDPTTTRQCPTYQTRSTLKPVKAASLLTIGRSSICAWAASMRSKGSR